MKRLVILMSSMAVLLTAISCSSTKVTSSWKANDANVNYQKVLVLGMMNKDNDRSIKENMERQLASQLSAAGINAVSASSEFGPKAFARINNEERALKMLRNKGYDAVMTIVLLDKAKEKNYTPGNVTYQPYGFYYNRFWGYYRTVYGRVYTPGYYTTNTNYFWESNLYDLRDNKLLYSVQSKSFDPSSSETLGEEYAHQITKDMVKQGLLVKK